MKMKADLGTDFFITQLCFDSCAVVSLFERLAKAVCTRPS
jgi:5,10-methylenetetrahydrofolate reductase